MSCEYCKSGKVIETDHGTAECVRLIPLPPINLTTGELEVADKPYYAVCVRWKEGGEDYIPANFCLNCGEPLAQPEVLSLEQLREVQNSTAKQIWIKTLKYNQILPAILDFDFISKEVVAIWAYRMQPYRERDYGKTWFAYARKPREG